MNPILDALRTALASYKDELLTNEREAANASEYLHVLGKRHLYLEAQIAEITAEITSRKEDQSAPTP